MTAEELDRILAKDISAREKAVDEIAALVSKAWAELAPTVEVLKKHGILFKNDLIGRETPCGVLIGQVKEAEGRRLMILEGERVFYAAPGGDGLNAADSIPLKKFIDTADLGAMKAGLLFVRNAQVTVEAG